MEGLFTTPNLIQFATLAFLEIVLGIDNVIFISILSAKLPKEQQPRARQLGIAIAVVSRIIFLVLLASLIGQLKEPFLHIFGKHLSGRDLILIIGGLFLIGKSTKEIYEKLEGEEHGHAVDKKTATLSSILFQILLVDVVFSLDSVITAIGIVGDKEWGMTIMVSAVMLAAICMVLFANAISSFIERHPAFKMLALSFLILIGAVLVIEGWAHELAHEIHIKNYVYFTMAFSTAFQLLLLNFAKRSAKPVKLHEHNKPV